MNYYYTTLQYTLLRIKVYLNQSWEETIFDEKKKDNYRQTFYKENLRILLLLVKASCSTGCKLSINSFGIPFCYFFFRQHQEVVNLHRVKSSVHWTVPLTEICLPLTIAYTELVYPLKGDINFRLHPQLFIKFRNVWHFTVVSKREEWFIKVEPYGKYL